MSLTPRLRCCSAQEGKSALHWAAQFGEPGLLHELLGPSAAADVNSADEAGNTPLHLAALNDHLCVVSKFPLSARNPPHHLCTFNGVGT